MKKTSFVIALFLVMMTCTAHAAQPGNLKKCQICHGKDLQGTKKNPPLLGLSFDELMASLTSNVPKKMNRIANKLTHKEKEEISKYISSLGVTNK